MTIKLLGRMIGLSVVLLYTAFSSVQGANVSPERELDRGDLPHCAIDGNGVLHIGYFKGGTYNGITYYLAMQPDGTLSSPEMVPMGDRTVVCDRSYGKSIRVCVDLKNNLHFVWTIGNAYYTNRIGGSWKNRVMLPEKPAACNFHPKITGGYQDEMYIHTWNYGNGGNNLYKISDVYTASPKAALLFQNTAAENRDGAVAGPTAQAAGDSKVYWADGVQHPSICLLNSNGTKGTCNGARMAGSGDKTGEGYDMFFAGNDVALLCRVINCPTINTLSRAKAGKSAIVVGADGYGHGAFPRGAWDPVTAKAYILYLNEGRPMLSIVDLSTEKVEKYGALSAGPVSTDGRGPGAGGICPRKGGGVHIVYSVGDRLLYRTVNAPATGMTDTRESAPAPPMASGLFRGRSVQDWYKTEYSALYSIKGKTVDHTRIKPGIYIHTAGTGSAVRPGKIIILE